MSSSSSTGRSRSPKGPINFPNFQLGGWYHRIFLEAGFFDKDKPLGDYSDASGALPLRPGGEGQGQQHQPDLHGAGRPDPRSHLVKDRESLQPHIRAAVERISTQEPCPACGGTRLNETARSSKINGQNIADVSAMQITDLADWLRKLGNGGAGRAADRRQHGRPAGRLRDHRPGLPVARPGVVHAVRAGSRSGPRWCATWARR